MAAIGVGLAAGVAGNVAVGISQALQKYGIERAGRLGITRLRDPVWVGAMLLFFLGELCGNLVALATSSPAVVAPLGSLAILSNAAVSSKLLREPLHAHKVSGSFLLIAGVILLLLAAPRATPALTPNDAFDRLFHPAFAIVMTSSGALALFLLWSTQRRRATARMSGVMGHSTLIGLLGAFTILAVKVLTGLLEARSSTGSSADDSEIMWMTPLMLMLGAWMLLVEYLKQRALTFFEASKLFPFVFASYNFFVVCTSLAFFRNLELNVPEFFALFAVGVVLIFNGISRFGRAPDSDALPPPVSGSANGVAASAMRKSPNIHNI